MTRGTAGVRSEAEWFGSTDGGDGWRLACSRAAPRTVAGPGKHRARASQRPPTRLRRIAAAPRSAPGGSAATTGAAACVAPARRLRRCAPWSRSAPRRVAQAARGAPAAAMAAAGRAGSVRAARAVGTTGRAGGASRTASAGSAATTVAAGCAANAERWRHATTARARARATRSGRAQTVTCAGSTRVETPRTSRRSAISAARGRCVSAACPIVWARSAATMAAAATVVSAPGGRPAPTMNAAAWPRITLIASKVTSTGSTPAVRPERWPRSASSAARMGSAPPASRAARASSAGATGATASAAGAAVGRPARGLSASVSASSTRPAVWTATSTGTTRVA